MLFSSHRNKKIILMIFWFTTLQYLPFVSAGICWYKMDAQGYCKETLKYKVSKEKCCGDGSIHTAWSPDDLRDDILFLQRSLEKGVPCKACKETCEGVKCGKNKKCVMKEGRPVCVCSPKCKYLNYKKGPVCGTDNKSYKSVCRLKKQRCRTKNSSLKINYYGFCQNSCKNIKCKRGKYCVQDQNLNAHCVGCSRSCNHPGSWKAPLCGDNGVTYRNSCQLESASCYSGKTITIAYKETCKTNATCDNINCSPGEKCLINKNTGLPKCVNCFNCQDDNEIVMPICGSNNETYKSLCGMIDDSCKKGYVIQVQSTGSCELKNTLDYSVMHKYW